MALTLFSAVTLALSLASPGLANVIPLRNDTVIVESNLRLGAVTSDSSKLSDPETADVNLVLATVVAGSTVPVGTAIAGSRLISDEAPLLDAMKKEGLEIIKRLIHTTNTTNQTDMEVVVGVLDKTTDMVLPILSAPISLDEISNSTDTTNMTETSDLSRRLSPIARHLTMPECKGMPRHQPMCCRHGWGSHHHQCQIVYETATGDPKKPVTWYGCDRDYSHAYCCLDSRMRTGRIHGQWQCPFHLTYLDYMFNWGADRILY